ncbi:MAG: hypothetical protein QXX20_06050 [Candidatus Thermoplasmatota archaeon]
MKKGGFFAISILLMICLSATPVIGSIRQVNQQELFQTEQHSQQSVKTITFFDCTGSRTQKKEIQIPESELESLKNELRTIRTTSNSPEESIKKQLTVFQKYHFISEDVTYEKLQQIAQQRFQKVSYSSHKKLPAPIINNSVFNAMCAIDFELINGTTAVFGLNTFINYIGFDIISFHYGYAVNGIDTKGLLQRSNDPGNYVGTMFGFLGFWLGEKKVAGIYTNVTTAGFTVITGWVPVPDFS